MHSLNGKTVVVTGYASGIGASTASKLTELGALVIGVDRSDTGSAPRVARTIVGDLSTYDGVRAVAEAIEGPIDVLVNNAGVAATHPWRTVLSVNALAARDLTRLLLPKFGPQPVVVATGSQTGFQWQRNFARANAFLEIDDWSDALDSVSDLPDIDQLCYALSKEVAIVHAGNLAVEGKRVGLRSNSVSPGTVGTPLLQDFRATIGDELINRSADWAGRHAAPEEIADAIVFLASAESSWISGVDLPVDGGYGSFIFRTLVAPAMNAAS
ncbi:SDR family oxidoreductase [Rhodococcus globerulus]|uniref:SDR family oxidoreductase n=1 Tax=Rhodococcus globerulus TaxID=33008 RepID=A0ABU4C4I1_RHOGO|nr:SDR family oxidoreductase [Rhodococcus globerulus]MDV6271397.1 SDR family oxidoreductase [Rhodococcus globerulus]